MHECTILYCGESSDENRPNDLAVYSSFSATEPIKFGNYRPGGDPLRDDVMDLSEINTRQHPSLAVLFLSRMLTRRPKLSSSKRNEEQGVVPHPPVLTLQLLSKQTIENTLSLSFFNTYRFSTFIFYTEDSTNENF
jgi:hypothetical protein